MKLPLVVLILLYVNAAAAQHSLAFRSQNYAGLLMGENGSGFQFQSINGVQKGGWFSGLGVGVDTYIYRSVPLFLSINKDWKPVARTFFLSLDGGTNFGWVKRPENRTNIIKDDFTPGLYWASGIGYKALFNNKNDAILINISYSYKELKEEQEKSTFCITPPCPNIIDRYEYKMKRVAIRLGWQF